MSARHSAALLMMMTLGCSVGEGEGFVRSERLFVDGCWEGGFDLRPTFFAANPFEDDLTIRVQRGEEDVLVSDGVTLLIQGVEEIRREGLGQRLELGLPRGVAPVGFPLPTTPSTALASMSLYLNDSCRNQNAALSAVGGWVRFDTLFSGNPNEDEVEDRVTNGRFEAVLIDPRDAVAIEGASEAEPLFEYPEDRTSRVEGEFSFVFHRGTPAQPFP